MTQATQDIVQKLWNLCNVLRDDGVTYHQYVTELTYLLFLKMAKETSTEDKLPEGYRWDDLENKARAADLLYYKELLLHLGSNGSRITREIFAEANTFLRKPSTLAQLVASIDALDWYSARDEGLGDLYEGLLEKNASEKKSGAGQYFTPRVLIDVMVELSQPQLGEVIQDPAAGTGGFLISAYHYLHNQHDFDDFSVEQYAKVQKQFYGMEFVHDAYRLALMNLMLHDLEADGDIGIRFGDTLSSEGERLPKADLILTNPPFGTKKGGGLPTRTDFTYPTSNTLPLS
jgi:type I restriction enzyme M protein